MIITTQTVGEIPFIRQLMHPRCPQEPVPAAETAPTVLANLVAVPALTMVVSPDGFNPFKSRGMIVLDERELNTALNLTLSSDYRESATYFLYSFGFCLDNFL
jgi:hypothetical protein